jgi:predicted dinucleotide-utilizing enzyme
MTDKIIRVALVGLNEVGEVFAEHFLEQLQEGHKPVEIVAVADPNPNSPVALGFAQNKVPVYTNPSDVARLGDKLDIIFDLTGDSAIRQQLRLTLLEKHNLHTVIASEEVARLLWCFFNEKKEFPTLNRK